MVMATGSTCRRQSAASSPFEVAESSLGQSGDNSEVMALHDRLVAYVHAIDNPQDASSAVWVEHSYALCGRGVCGAGAGGGGAGGGAGAGAVRVLLAPRVDPAPADDDLDVAGSPPRPPSPPDEAPASDDEDGDDDDEWEARLSALAPHADHARLAATVVDCLRRVRLAKLAGGRFAERAMIGEQARRLRLALAPLWAGGGGGGGAGGSGGAQRPAPWLHAAVFACAPPGPRRAYEKLEAELRRLVPRLADRLTGVRAPAAPLAANPASEPTCAVEASQGPWLVWVGAGRWARLLGALVHTRALPLRGPPAPPAPPDQWCAAAAGAVRAAFADVLAEAGSRGVSVVVGGCGGGAALAGALAGGGAVRGALLLGPPLITAEGPGRLPRGPALAVAGGSAVTSWRGALCSALGERQRLLLVAGADDALRLPRALLRRKRLTQRALDAAVAEECVRWIHEVCEQRDDEPDDETPLLQQGPTGAESSEEEYAHLPAARSPPAPPAPPPAAPAPLPVPPLAPLASHAPNTPHTPHKTTNTGNESRSIEIVEGRVVTRVSGGTPLALLPPRRSEPRAEPSAEPLGEPRGERLGRERRAKPAPVPLAAADIMQLPIVFADDERTVVPHTEAVAEPSGPVTVTSAARRCSCAAACASCRAPGPRRSRRLHTRVTLLWCESNHVTAHSSLPSHTALLNTDETSYISNYSYKLVTKTFVLKLS